MSEDLRNVVIDAVIACLDAQLRAVQRLRKGPMPEKDGEAAARLSQVDMAYDILKKARAPLHVHQLLDRIHAAFKVRVDRESSVSSLTKKIARGDRFVRTSANTFGLRLEAK